MFTTDFAERYQPYALAALRIAVSLLFLEHGTQKLFNFPASVTPATLSALIFTAGLLEFVGGFLVLIGYKTRPVAFILSGEMAVAYFTAHFPRDFFPVVNRGDAAILFCFAYFYLSFAGAGKFSLDQWRKKAVATAA